VEVAKVPRLSGVNLPIVEPHSQMSIQPAHTRAVGVLDVFNGSGAMWWPFKSMKSQLLIFVGGLLSGRPPRHHCEIVCNLIWIGCLGISG
jgi:hypothetical protein